MLMPDSLDHRLHAYRDDLADARLRGRVQATRFTEGNAYRVTAEIAPVYPRPTQESDLDTQALYGEALTVFDVTDDWAWCQLHGDGYVGYIPIEFLDVREPAGATHKIAAPQVFAYSKPDAASKPMKTLLLGTTITVTRESGEYFEISTTGRPSFVGKRHVEPREAISPDYVTTAEMLLRAPYLWGGKSARGVDCSGLVQLSLIRAGVECPRDTDMQESALPGDIPVDEDVLSCLRRGDIVYWPRHVGIMIDGTHMIHASGTMMATEIEPVCVVAERSRKGGPVVSAVKRI